MATCFRFFLEVLEHTSQQGVCRYHLVHWESDEIQDEKPARSLVSVVQHIPTYIFEIKISWLDALWNAHLETIHQMKIIDTMLKIGWPLQRNAQFWWRQFPTSSWIHMLELIKTALRFGQKPPSTQHIVSVIFVENTSYVHLTRFWDAGMKSERSKHVM